MRIKIIVINIFLQCLLLFHLPATAAVSKFNSASIGGLYHVVSSKTDMDETGYRRSVGQGKLFLNSRKHSFIYKVVESGNRLTRFCTDNEESGSCNRTYIRDKHKYHEYIRGTYKVTATGKIVFTLRDRRHHVLREVEGFASQDGLLVFIPFNFDNNVQFALSIKMATSLTDDALNGDYALSRISDTYPKAIHSKDGNWKNFLVSVASGDLQLMDRHYKLYENSSLMMQDINGIFSQSDCKLSAQLSSTQQLTTVAGDYHLHSNGRIIFASKNRHKKTRGIVSPDKSLIATIAVDNHGSVSYSLFTQKGIDMTSADIVGQFHVFTQEQFFNEEGETLLTNPNGIITFDGLGGWNFDGRISGILREEHSANPLFEPISDQAFSVQSDKREMALCLDTMVSAFGPFPAGASGTYAVNADGSIAMTGIDTGGGVVEFSGNIAADGEVFTLRRVADSVPCAIGCASLESARSVVIGIK